MKNKIANTYRHIAIVLAASASLWSVAALAQTKVDTSTAIPKAKPTTAVAKPAAAVNAARGKAASIEAEKAAKAAMAAYEEDEAKYSAAAQAIMRASFKERGQVKLDRLDQDGTQELCSKYAERENNPGYKFTDGKFIEAANLKTLVYPADGVFLGDWKEGEKIAQLGVGKQFSDDATKPSGGNCYACHKLDPKEISYGNLGPSLYQYGKLRGNTQATQKYTYGKIYNSNAYSACSNMPRFGHAGILTPEQIKHVTALLLDPESPVNAK
jgi:L-cysteine S-thiosulfotransferase